MKVALGGERLGSGNKQDLELHNYYRSTHDLSRKFVSSMTNGVLYPFMVIPAMRGDTFTIDLQAAARTIPTKGPLFGSFKMQTDVFFCPIRLYQGILHNNPLAIGLKMNQVKFPIITFKGKGISGNNNYNYEQGKISDSCLMKYLGLSGIGTFTYAGAAESVERQFNAIPVLAYYDIFKNYYANKQEEKAYVLGQKKVTYDSCKVTSSEQGDSKPIYNFGSYQCTPINTEEGNDTTFTLEVTTEDSDRIEQLLNTMFIQVYQGGEWVRLQVNFADYFSNTISGSTIEFTSNDDAEATEVIRVCWRNISEEEKDELNIIPFNLSNIDDMRMNLLSSHTLGTAYKLPLLATNAETFEENLPYSQVNGYEESGVNNLSKMDLNGLMLKTYQADLFNAWVNTDWIDGENGIAELTKIAVSDGSVYIDSINLAEKLYNMLNRVAVSGGTYEDWQDAVFTDTPRKQIESPIYLGGMSSEVVFEEIVQTAGGEQPLGTLGGRGILLHRKGGNIDCKVDEAGFIIGIVSLTPRIYYSQSNEFYLTDLFTMDDFHKPALDGIGFQDLIGERLAWWDTHINSANTVIRSKIGKVPAWIEYMTAVDKSYADFAKTSGDGFMVLQRNYEKTNDNKIKDATTYIDPQKYNYAFAYDALDSQNFWVEIDAKIIARRLMSAKQIPNI